MISKYKIYLFKNYGKIKNKQLIEFSIINDIITFISNYNNKYKQKLDFNLILQSSEEDMNLVYKTADYLLDFYFDIVAKDEECDNKLYNDLLSEIRNEDSTLNNNDEEDDSIHKYQKKRKKELP